MFIIARPDCLSVVMVLLKHVFRRFIVLNDLSHSAENTGNVQRVHKAKGSWAPQHRPPPPPPSYAPEKTMKRTSPTSKKIIVRGVARIFQRGGHRQGHHPGIADYIYIYGLYRCSPS